MRRVKQIEAHFPELGYYGDCLRASVASVLEMRPTDVPHFCDGGDPVDMRKRLNAFFEPHDLYFMELPFPLEPHQLLEYMGHWFPGHWIMTGELISGVAHCVVCKGGEIVHNPAPTKEHTAAAIVNPIEGFTWGCFFVRKYDSLFGL